MEGRVEKSLYIQKVAHRIGVPEGVVEAEVLKKSKKGRNFLVSPAEEERRIPVVERALVEILLSGIVSPEKVFAEIRADDFTFLPLREVWEGLRGDFEGHGRLEVSRAIQATLAPEAKGLLTELATQASGWEEQGATAALECLRRFRKDRNKDVLKEISREIQDAERDQDLTKVQSLLERKKGLLKEMTTLH